MQDVVLDTCCLINLFAAGRILSGDAPPPKPRGRPGKRPGPPPDPKKLYLDYIFHIPAKVKEEARYIRQPDKKDESKLVKAEIDLAPLVTAGFLHECDLQSDVETQLFVQLAAKLDDGEAACFAIAKSRGWLLASDERPTENLAKKHGVALVTTPELVKHWADKTKPKKEEVAKALWNIQTYAHYFPRKTIPLYSWWMDILKKVTS
jgi:predicted nucleic acid-binding protein